MNDKKEPPRGLEKVCHFFLTEETQAQQDEGATGGGSIVAGVTPSHPESTPQQCAVEYDRLKNTVAELYVLKESCKGTDYLQNSSTDTNWFKGAEAILHDAIGNLIKTLRFIGQ